jgi:3-oxoadipate enol-lactonase
MAGHRYRQRRHFLNHEDLAALLDYLDVERVHVVGWSFGSGIAFDFVAVFATRTLSIASIGPWVNGYSSPRVEQLLGSMGQLSTELVEGGTEVGVDAWMRLIFPTAIRDAAAREEFGRVAADYSWRAFMNDNQARPLTPSAAEQLGDVEVPTLVVTAEHDLAACQEIGQYLMVLSKTQS